MKSFDFRAGEAGKRQTVVLLHSSASSSRQWNALVERLGVGFNVHTVDFHGHGAQPAWIGPKPLSLADEVRLVEPILRSAGCVHLVGHSYGGAVALKVAELHPQSVRSLAVYEPVLFPWLFAEDPSAGAVRDVLAVSGALERHVEQGDVHAAAAVFVNYWSGAGAWEQLRPSRQDAIAARMRAVQPHFAALYREDFLRIRVLASRSWLYLTGTATAASTRRLGAIAREALPHAAHEQIAGAGHMGPITHETQVNARIERFLVAQSTPNRAARRRVAWKQWCRRAGANAVLGARTADA
jgi:pimeloyl-ACP methyl ester carboxylesterase